MKKSEIQKYIISYYTNRNKACFTTIIGIKDQTINT